MPLKILLFRCLGPMLYLMVGPWSGNRPRPTPILTSNVMLGLSMMLILATCIVIVLWICYSANFYNVSVCNIKCVGDWISGLTFVWGNLIWSCVSVVYRDVTRQAKGLYRLKYVGALGSGLAYLSRYNSGWFCHIPIGLKPSGYL
jgi:hypothetical protein